MLRIALTAVGALALMAGACNTNYQDSELYNDSAYPFYDMECSNQGCFFCEDDGSCVEYRCDFTHQCPKGRICGIQQRCLPGDGADPDGTYRPPTDPNSPTDPNNPTDPTNPYPGSNQSCTAHADCPAGEICTLDGVCVTSPGTPGQPPTGDPNDPTDPPTDPTDPPTDPTDPPTDPTDPPTDPTDPPTDPTDPPTDPTDPPTDPTDPNQPIPLPDHPEDQCVVNDDCGLDGICLNAGCYFPCAADNGCPPRQFCSEGQCLPLAGSENECTFNGECGPDMLCIEGTCYNGCAESLECASHEACETGLCVADISPAIQCSGANTCAAGEGCFNGKCLGTCTATEATVCGDASSCTYGYCHQDVFCLDNGGCNTTAASGTDVCLDGTCQANPFPSAPN